ncbi:MAG: HGGxSTG domain-containing protein [Geminicoccaceae bacterium]
MPDRCGAKNRAGRPCRCPILYPNGRCRMHGGPCSKHRTERKPMPPEYAPWIWRLRPMTHRDILRPFFPPRLDNTGLSSFLKEGEKHGHDPRVNLPIARRNGPIPCAFWVCSCGRRTATLFSPLKRTGFDSWSFDHCWQCRVCCGYRHAGSEISSEGRGLMLRALGQVQRIERIIGKGKPRRMQWRTYNKLRKQLDHYSHIALREMQSLKSSSERRLALMSQCKEALARN